MLNASAIVDTLVDGCVAGDFVLQLKRPDKTVRTWWRTRPDEEALKDPDMEVVLSDGGGTGGNSWHVIAQRDVGELMGNQSRAADVEVQVVFCGRQNRAGGPWRIQRGTTGSEGDN